MCTTLCFTLNYQDYLPIHGWPLLAVVGPLRHSHRTGTEQSSVRPLPQYPAAGAAVSAAGWALLSSGLRLSPSGVVESAQRGSVERAVGAQVPVEVELELGKVSRDSQVSAYVTRLTCADALLAV